MLGTWTGAKDFIRGGLSTNFDLGGAGSQPNQILRSLTAVGPPPCSTTGRSDRARRSKRSECAGMPKLKQMHFADLRMPFRVERGRRTDEATINGPNGKWVTTGGIGFDGAMDYVVSVTLPPDVVARLGAQSALAAGALGDSKGNLLIDFRVSGTAKSPRVTLDLASMRNRALGRASEALEAEKQKLLDEGRRTLEAQQRAAQDSMRRVLDQQKRAFEDSLRRKAGDVLKGFFSGGTKGAKKDTAAARDTTAKP